MAIFNNLYIYNINTSKFEKLSKKDYLKLFNSEIQLLTSSGDTSIRDWIDPKILPVMVTLISIFNNIKSMHRKINNLDKNMRKIVTNSDGEKFRNCDTVSPDCKMNEHLTDSYSKTIFRPDVDSNLKVESALAAWNSLLERVGSDNGLSDVDPLLQQNQS